VDVNAFALMLADRQYSALLKVLTDHSRAWEARALGLPFVCPPPLKSEKSRSSTVAAITSPAGSSAAALGVTARAARKRHAPLWRLLFHALVARHRAMLRERDRLAFVASVLPEYGRLYLRRLRATELLGLPHLTAAERRACEAIEADPRLTADDVLALRRAAERAARERLHLPLVDISRRRDREVQHYLKSVTAKEQAQKDPVASKRGGAEAARPSSKAAASTKVKASSRQLDALPAASRRSVTAAAPAPAGAKPPRVGGVGGGTVYDVVDSDEERAEIDSHQPPPEPAAKGGVRTSFFSKLFKVGKGSATASSKAPKGRAAVADSGGEADSSDATGIERELDRALASLTPDDLARLYDGLGYEYDATSGTAAPRAGSEAAAAAADAAVIANKGLPRTYVWLRLYVEVGRIAITLLEHAGSAAGTAGRGTGLGGRGLMSGASAAAPAGSMSASGTVREVTRLSIARSCVGLDVRAGAWSAGVDIGDVTVIDCGTSANASTPAHATGLLGGRRGGSFLVHRHIVFSDHSRDEPGAVSGGVAGGASGFARGLSHRHLNVTPAPTVAGSTRHITEASICEEIVVAEKSASASRKLGAASSRRVGGLGSTESSGVNADAYGGGGLPSNPIRAGLLSLRLVGNPDEGITATVISSTSAVAPALRKQHQPDSSLSPARSSGSPSGVKRQPPVSKLSTRETQEPDSDDDENNEAEEDDYLASASRRGGRAQQLSQRKKDRLGGDSRSRRYRDDEYVDEAEPEDDSRGVDILGAKKRASARVSTAEAPATVAAWLRCRLAARPLVVVWSPPYIRRLMAWLGAADDLAAWTSSTTAAAKPPPQPGLGTNTAAVLGMVNRYAANIVASASAALEGAIASQANRSASKV
jgi:hypothetical protein